MWKKNKGKITERIYNVRMSIREMDSLLLELEKYFSKVEKKWGDVLGKEK